MFSGVALVSVGGGALMLARTSVAVAMMFDFSVLQTLLQLCFEFTANDGQGTRAIWSGFPDLSLFDAGRGVLVAGKPAIVVFSGSRIGISGALTRIRVMEITVTREKRAQIRDRADLPIALVLRASALETAFAVLLRHEGGSVWIPIWS